MRTEDITPALYLFPTEMSTAPVSNVIPPHNIDIMEGIRYFVVENLRTARRWIRKCIPGFSFDGVERVELNRHTSPDEISGMLEPLRRGEAVGVMSEAGCPAVADPGADLVAIAQREGLKVVPLVGPSSILMSLMGSGFNGQSFCFHGYLPIDEKQRRRALSQLERESERDDRTQIFIETPYRNNRMVAVLAESLSPDTLVCVAADITDPEKETILTMPVKKWKTFNYNFDKRPAIFLIYRGYVRQGMKFAVKSRR